MTNSKVKQFQTKLTVECPGHPAISNKDGRRICKRTTDISIAQAGGSPFSEKLLGRRTILAALQKKGWTKLKTLGFFQTLCPRCSKVVLEQRAANTHRWG